MQFDLFLSSYLNKICLTLSSYDELIKFLKTKLKGKYLVTLKVNKKENDLIKKKKIKNLKFISSIVFLKNNSLKYKKLPSLKSVNLRLHKAKDWPKIEKMIPKIGTSRIFYDENIKKKLRENYLKTWIYNFFKGNRADKLSVCVKKGSDEILGFILLRYNKGFYVYDQLFVGPNARGMGVGSKMILWTNKKFCEGLPVISGVHSKNPRAIKLYKSLGYKIIDELYYHHLHC